MALREKELPSLYQDYKKVEPGTEFKGWLLAKPAGENGNNYILRTEDGADIGLYGTGVLRRFVDDEPVGTYLVVTYTGKERINKGPNAGKFAHQFKVQIDDDKFNDSLDTSEVNF